MPARAPPGHTHIRSHSAHTRGRQGSGYGTPLHTSRHRPERSRARGVVAPRPSALGGAVRPRPRPRPRAHTRYRGPLRVTVFFGLRSPVLHIPRSLHRGSGERGVHHRTSGSLSSRNLEPLLVLRCGGGLLRDDDVSVLVAAHRWAAAHLVRVRVRG